MTASPMSGGVARPRRRRRPVAAPCRPAVHDRRPLARSRRCHDRAGWRTASRWFGVSMNPPVPMKPPLREPQQAGVERVRGHRHDLLQRDARACGAAPDRPGRGASSCARPRSATFATPGTRSSRARIVPVGGHRQVDEGVLGSDVMPIFMTRLVADSGWIMTGGAAQVGSVGRDRRDPLRDQLPRSQQVGARLEDQLDLTTAARPTSSASCRAPGRRSAPAPAGR